MTAVNTVLGPVESADLGPTYMHEHIFVTTSDVQINYPDEWGTDDARVAEAVSRLTELTAQGIRTIVDPTVVGLGRYLPRIQRVAQQLPNLKYRCSDWCVHLSRRPLLLQLPGSGGQRHRGRRCTRPDGRYVRL